MNLPAYRPCRHLLMILIVAVLLSGCGLKPWVQPYERENFADPIMSLSRNPIADRYRQHVMEVREGARGASVTQGGGCGCN